MKYPEKFRNSALGRRVLVEKRVVRTSWPFRIVVLVVVGLFFVLTGRFWLLAAGRSLVHEAPLRPADAILVEHLETEYLLFEQAGRLQRRGMAPRVVIPVLAPPEDLVHRQGSVPVGLTEVMIRVARIRDPELVTIDQEEPISLNAARQLRDYLESGHGSREAVSGFRFRVPGATPQASLECGSLLPLSAGWSRPVGYSPASWRIVRSNSRFSEPEGVREAVRAGRTDSGSKLPHSKAASPQSSNAQNPETRNSELRTRNVERERWNSKLGTRTSELGTGNAKRSTPVKSIIVVASGFRSERTYLIYRSVFEPLGIDVQVEPVFSAHEQDDWPDTTHGIQEVGLQFLKLWYYRLFVL